MEKYYFKDIVNYSIIDSFELDFDGGYYDDNFFWNDLETFTFWSNLANVLTEIDDLIDSDDRLKDFYYDSYISDFDSYYIVLDLMKDKALEYSNNDEN